MKRLIFFVGLLGAVAAAVYFMPEIRRAIGLTVGGELPIGESGCPQGMVAIEGDTFTMGDKGAKDDRGPAHQVTLGAFCIDRTEVTVAAYRRCIEAGACVNDETLWKRCNLNRSGVDDHPVNCVSFESATTYCGWIGGRLPTEAEWEYAARGKDGRRFPWGNQRPTRKRAHFSPGKHWMTETMPVTSLPEGATPHGLLHMAGNVCELVADRYGPYPKGQVTDPQGPSSGKLRVCRGGSLNNKDAAAVSSTFRRRGFTPGESDDLTGMRCAADKK